MSHTDIYILIGFVPLFVMSIVLHEVAHGWVAYRCGDPTAYQMGRLTLNPIKHIDPFMTILLPVLCYFVHAPIFGGAKPVPVNPYNFRHPRRDDIMVSAAGVATNLAIALVLSVVFRILLATHALDLNSVGAVVLMKAIFLNLVLFIFNLLPIPPLDGSRILRQFLPENARQMFGMLDAWGLFIVFLVIQLPMFDWALWAAIGLLWNNFLMLGGAAPL